MPGLMKVVENGQTGWQIGQNHNLFDVTYIDNVVHAHLLAADKLDSPPLTLESILSEPLQDITLTTGVNHVPTSEARPLGPATHITPDLEKIRAAYETGVQDRPVVRTKFDIFHEQALELEDSNPLQVAGQAFFITNGEPLYFWDFTRAVWKAAGHVHQGRTVRLSETLGLMLGSAAEWWSWLMGKEPGFTRYRVHFACAHRWYNIEKARRVLGYEPKVGVEEGIQKMVEVSITLFLGIGLV